MSAKQETAYAAQIDIEYAEIMQNIEPNLVNIIDEHLDAIAEILAEKDAA